MKKRWIFDVCGTLFNSNTTFDFLNYCFAKHSPEKQVELLRIRKSKTLKYVYRAFMFKTFGKDLFKKKAVQLLKGFSVNLIESEASLFFEDFLIHHKIDEVYDLLKSQLINPIKPVLVSNSIDPIIKAIARKENIPYYSTTLEVNNGCYSGKIEHDLMGGKHLIQELIADPYTVVTDNRSDFELVRLATERHIVLHRERDRQFWKHLNPKFIIA